MFTRNNSSPEPEQPTTLSHSLNSGSRRVGPGLQTDGTGGLSVIGNDLKITGTGLKIISQGTLQVDGEIEGEVCGRDVIIGEKGRVTGTVTGTRVIVRGTVSGMVRAVSVILQASARVEGDVHNLSLAVEQGARFDGRSKRASDPSELNLDLGPVPTGATKLPA